MRPPVRLFKNTTYLTVGNQIGNLLQFLFFLCFARRFGEEVVGQYSFAFSFTFISTLIADLGLSAYLIREVARDRSGTRQLFARCLSLRLFALLMATLLAAVTVLAFSTYFSDGTIKIIVLLGLYHIFFSVADIYLGEFKGHDRMGLVALVDIFLKLIIAALGILLIFSGYSLFVVLVCFPIASLLYLTISIFLSFHYFRHSKPIFSDLDLQSLFVTILPFTFTLLFAHALYHQDILMLRVLQNDQAVGLFTVANRIVLAIMTVLVFVHTALLPTFSRLFIESKSELIGLAKQVSRYLLFIGLPLATGLFATSDRVIILLFSSSFENSIHALRVLSWTLAFGFAAATFSVLLTAIDRQTEKVYVLGTCLVANFLLNFFLIPISSYNGAATAKLLTEGLHLILMVYLVSKYLTVIPIHKIFFKPALSCLIMFIFIQWLHQWNLAYLILLSTVVYFSSLGVMGWYDKEEIEYVKILYKKMFLRSTFHKT